MTNPKKKFLAGGSVQHYFDTALKKIWAQGFGNKIRQLKLVVFLNFYNKHFFFIEISCKKFAFYGTFVGWSCI